MGNTIAEAIKKMAHPIFKDEYGVICTVKGGSIDLVNLTCVCSPITGETDIPGVRLQAQTGNGIVVIPVELSVVVVQPLNEITGYVALFSQVDSIAYFDGSFGGWVKATELKTQMDKTNAVVQAIVDSLTGWTPVPNDGGAALKTYFPTKLGTKVVGDFSNIENPKVTHGQ